MSLQTIYREYLERGHSRENAGHAVRYAIAQNLMGLVPYSRICNRINYRHQSETIKGVGHRLAEIHRQGLAESDLVEAILDVLDESTYSTRNWVQSSIRKYVLTHDVPVRVCSCCDDYVREDSLTYVEHDENEVCEDCLSNHYFCCDGYHEYYPDDECVTVDGEGTYSTAWCRANAYEWESDGEWHSEPEPEPEPDEDPQEVEYDEEYPHIDDELGQWLESHQNRQSREFLIPTRSVDGVQLIARLNQIEGYDWGEIIHKMIQEDGHVLGDIKWQAKRGNLPKRIAKTAAVSFNVKIPPTVLSLVGNVASTLAPEHETLRYSVFNPRKRNAHWWDRYEYGQESGSCWWPDGCYSGSRVFGSQQGGFYAVLLHGSTDCDEDGIGRCWLYQLGDGEAVIFNAYSKAGCSHTLYHFARLIAQSIGWQYAECNLKMRQSYINGGKGIRLSREYDDSECCIHVSQTLING